MFKIFIWGGISSDKRSEMFYVISDRIHDDIYTSPNENFEYVYPYSNVLFNLYTSKTLYFVQNVSFVS